MKDLHKHKCYSCGHVWQHDYYQLKKLSEEEFDKAHVCKCGRDVFERYYGPDKPTGDFFETLFAEFDAWVKNLIKQIGDKTYV